MKVKELMERIGINNTGKAVAYIKDGLEEIEMLTETHTRVERIDITENKRFYKLLTSSRWFSPLSISRALRAAFSPSMHYFFVAAPFLVFLSFSARSLLSASLAASSKFW